MHSLVKVFNYIEWALGIPQPKVIVLYYSFVDVNQFVDQINYLQSQGYKFIQATHVAEFVNGVRQINHKSVCITFDNLSRGNIDFAAMLLESRGIKATFFSYSDVQVHELKPFLNKNWEIGCLYSSRQVSRSKSELSKRFNKVINVLSCSNENYSNSLIKRVKKAGFFASFSEQQGQTRSGDNKFKLSRFDIDSKQNLDSFIMLFKNWSIIYWFFKNKIKANKKNRQPINSFEAYTV